MQRIVIFANGILNHPHLLRTRLRPADLIYCADGGARHALALGLTPHLVIGDLDSLAPETVSRLAAAGVEIQRHPVRKDQTDLELALQQALAQQPAEILLVTALGGRLDQMLANILLMSRPEYAEVRLSLIDGPQWATLLRDGQALTLTGHPGDTLSLVPLSPQVTGVTLAGVEWPLRQATLSLGSTWTISNTLAKAQATVQIGTGLVLLVHTEKNKEKDIKNETA